MKPIDMKVVTLSKKNSNTSQRSLPRITIQATAYVLQLLISKVYRI